MNILFTYVEGYYDRIFVENVLSDFFNEKHQMTLIPIEYSRKSKSGINKDIKSKSKYNYLLFADLDKSKYPCITSKKDKLNEVFSYLDMSKCFIVKEEIESWFLAGIDNNLDEFKAFDIPASTDSITKEKFDEILESNGVLDKSAFLIDVSKNFDIELATRRNSSFNYFIEKFS